MFDVVETMLSLAPVRTALQTLDVPLDLFFARMLRDGFALAAAESYRAFPDVARAALVALAPDASEDQTDAVLRAFNHLPAHPDAEPALAKLTGAGVTVVTLTNGGRQSTETLLATNGLDRYVERVLTVDDVQRWKPSPAPYTQALIALGRDAHDVALVAVHSWDIHGAHHAGLVTGWCSRLEGQYPSIFEPPDVTGDDLLAVADALLALPADTTGS